MEWEVFGFNTAYGGILYIPGEEELLWLCIVLCQCWVWCFSPSPIPVNISTEGSPSGCVAAAARRPRPVGPTGAETVQPEAQGLLSWSWCSGRRDQTCLWISTGQGKWPSECHHWAPCFVFEGYVDLILTINHLSLVLSAEENDIGWARYSSKAEKHHPRWLAPLCELKFEQKRMS